MEQFGIAIIKFSFVPSLVVAIYTLWVFKALTIELRTFSFFIFLSALIELISRVFWIYGKNNLPLLHVYVAVGFTGLALFYQQVLRGFIDRKIIAGSLIVFLSFTVINSIFIQPVLTYNSYALTAESVLIIILSLSTFILMMDDIVKKKRARLSKSLNWINSGLFIYYSSGLIIFYFGNLITLFEHSVMIKYTWILHAFFSATMYACLFLGIWYRPKT